MAGTLINKQFRHFFLFGFLPLLILAQTPEVNFVVRDASNGNSVSEAVIFFQNAHISLLSDEQGGARVRLTGKYEKLNFLIYRLDYDTLHFQMNVPRADTVVVVHLTPHPVRIKPVEVTGISAGDNPGEAIRWESLEWRRSPLIINDPLRVVTSHPAAQAITDYSSQFYVRGGTPDQTLFYLDGIPISNPYRLRLALGGGFSLLNPLMVQKVEFYPGIFPVTAGGQQAGLVEISSRDGSASHHHLRLGLNPFEGSVQVEGPFWGKRIRMNAAIRQSIIDRLLGMVLKEDVIRPRFGDFQGNLVMFPGSRQHLKIGWLLSWENSRVASSDSGSIGNSVSVETLGKTKFSLLYARHQIRFQGDRLVLRHLFTYKVDSSSYHYAVLSDTPGEETRQMDLSMWQRYLQFRQILTAKGKRLQFRSGWGMQAGSSRFQSNQPFLQFEVLDSMTQSYKPFSGEAFAEAEWNLFTRWQLQGGLRIDYFSLYSQSPRLSPRLKIEYQPSIGMRLFLGGGIYHQFPFLESMLYRIPAINVFRDPEFSTTPPKEPERFRKGEVGGRWWINPRFQINLSAFYAYSGNLLESYRSDRWWTSFTQNSGKFRSRGIEVWLHWKSHSDASGASLFFSGAYHRSEQFYRHAWHPAYGDARWSLMLKATVPLPAGMFVSSQGILLDYLSTLQEVALLVRSKTDEVKLNDKYLFRISEENQYFRWDMRLGWRQGSRLSVYLDIINLTNHRNLFSRNYITEQISSVSRLKELSIYNFPFFVFIGMQWRVL